MSDPEAESTLLATFLESQRGQLDVLALVECLNAWTVDPSQSLDQMLIQRGLLAESSRAALLEQVKVRLRLQGEGDSKGSPLLDRTDIKPFENDDPNRNPGNPDPWATLPNPPEQEAPTPPTSGALKPPGERFQVVELHAKGGLGVVSIALDCELDRRVALKEIKEKLADDPGSRARFLREAEITGKLEHPGIIPIYALGTNKVGRPFYAMRFIEGETLQEAILRLHRPEGPPLPLDAWRLLLRDLLGRFLNVCDAIEYAHNRGVIHRDIKPGNIMLGPFGETLVVDWGLAKTLDDPDLAAEPTSPLNPSPSPSPSPAPQVGGIAPPAPPSEPSTWVEPRSGGRLRLSSGSETIVETLAGSAIGTPTYMSPEQAEGKLDQIGTPSDVYSLGATLYHLLTGKPPIEDGSIEEILDRVRRSEILPPSERNLRIPKPLEAICLKALAKDPDQRYPSARALADDLKRWLADEPVLARPESWFEQLSRWGRRHRTFAAASVIILVLGLFSLLLIARARYEQAEALAHARTSELIAEAARQNARLQSYYALINRARERASGSEPGWTFTTLENLGQAARLRAIAEIEDSPAEAASLRTLTAFALASFDSQLAPDLEPGLNPSALAFSPDGQTLALGEFKAQAFLSCSVALLDWKTGTVQRLSFPPSFSFQLRRKVQDGARRITFSPEGRLLVVGTRSGQLHAWDLAQNDPVNTTWDAHQADINALAFGEDEGTLLSSSDDGTLKRWRLDETNGQLLADLVSEFQAPGKIFDMAFHPEGGLFCLTNDQIQPLDPEELTPIGSPIERNGDRLAFHPDGTILAVGNRDGITLIEASSGLILRTLTDPSLGQAHREPIHSLRFDSTGSTLVSTSSHDNDRTVKLWEVSTGKRLGSIQEGGGAGYNLLDAAIHPAGKHLVLTSRDRALVRLLSHRPAQRFLALEALPPIALAFAPNGNGSTLARLGGFRDREALRASVWDLPEGRQRAGIDLPAEAAPRDGLPGLAFDPTGQRMAISSAGTGILMWAPPADGFENVLRLPEPTTPHFSPDNQRIWALVDAGKTIGSWSLPEGEPVAQWSDPASAILRGLDRFYALEVAEPNILAGGRDGLTRLLHFDPEAGTLDLIRQWDHLAGPVRALAISPDSSVIVAGTDQGGLYLLDPSNPAPLDEIEQAHVEGLTTLVFHPEGQWLASGSHDRSVKIWQIVSNPGGQAFYLREVATLSGATGPILEVRFTPDGRQLGVAVEGEFALRLWNLEELSTAWASLGIDLSVPFSTKIPARSSSNAD